jgi:hypothetical protein
VPTFQKPLVGSDSNAGLSALLNAGYVDGFFISRGWQQVEDAGPGAFMAGSAACASILADLDAVADAGKKATLGIGAGGQAPPWVCDSGVACFTIVSEDPGGGPCQTVQYPEMWDPQYEAEFANLMLELAACVNTDHSAVAALVDVKITGLNDHDEETILPYQDNGKVLACTSGNACQYDAGSQGWCDTSSDFLSFVDAGYTIDAGWAAFASFAQATRTAFPSLPIGSQISSNLLYPAGVPDSGVGSYAFYMTEQLVADTAVDPITFQEQGLAATSGADTQGISYARDAGFPIGFQMLEGISYYDAGCAMARGLSGCTCPEECVLTAAIQNGLEGGARWLEIYWQDLAAFPDAGWYAHILLSDGG